MFHMVNDMRLRFKNLLINRLLDLKHALVPTQLSQRAPQPLRALRFAASRTDNLVDWDGKRTESSLQFQQGRWKIDAQDRFGMGPIFDLESLPFQSLNQHRAPSGQFLYKTLFAPPPR